MKMKLRIEMYLRLHLMIAPEFSVLNAHVLTNVINH